MSILTPPRLNFTGFTDFNPNTVNNSPSRYDEATATALDPDNVGWDHYVQWLSTYNDGTGDLNGSWNVYGDHAVSFVDAKVTGGQLRDGAVAADDPIRDAPVRLLGQVYTDSDNPPGRLVDVDSYSATSSQIYFERLEIGRGAGAPGVGGRGVGRMFSRWINAGQRNLLGSKLFITGSWGVNWWAAIGKEQLEWSGLEGSPALVALKTALDADPYNQGLVFRLVNYLTLYYQTVEWKGEKRDTAQKLAAAYQDGYRGGNPARSVLMGAVGIWGPGELASVATQRLLLPAPPGAPAAGSSKSLEPRDDALPPGPQWLAPAAAVVDRERSVVALDIAASFPETDKTLEKANLGSFVLKCHCPGEDKPLFVGRLTYQDYDRAAYLANGGVVEFGFEPDKGDKIAAGRLELLSESKGQDLCLVEEPHYVESDDRGCYVEQDGETEIVLRAFAAGAPAGAPLPARLVQYDNSWTRIDDPDDRIVELLAADGTPLPCGMVTVAPEGTTVRLRSLHAGICNIVYLVGDDTPAPPSIRQFGWMTRHFSVVRALPFDNELESGTSDSELSWHFIYTKVLKLYDKIYPIMSVVRDLEDRNVVDAMANQIRFAIDESRFPSTLYMPITRELSAGKRKLLLRYLNLLPNRVPPDPPGV